MRGLFRRKSGTPILEPDPIEPNEGSSSSASDVPTKKKSLAVEAAPTGAPVVVKKKQTKKKLAAASTPTVPSILKKPQPAPRTTDAEAVATDETVRTRKQVKFNEALNQRSAKAANSKYLKFCWYEKKELQLFAAVIETYSNELATDTSVNEQSYRRVISSVYGACRNAATLPSTYASTVLDDKQKQDLKKCIANGKNRFGLERLICKNLQKDATQRRAKMRETVQKNAKKEEGVDESWDLIANSLEPLSRPSRLFALEMGRAVSAGCS